MRRRGWVAIAVVLVVAFVAVEALSGTGKTAGRAAPALPTKVLRAPAVTVATLAGKPAIVHFWASWCGPCTHEAPELARLATELHGRATLVGVDYTDAAGSARSFIARHDWRFPILADPGGTIGDEYGLSGLPTTFVLDSSGHIVERLTGPQTAAGLLRAVAKVKQA